MQERGDDKLEIEQLRRKARSSRQVLTIPRNSCNEIPVDSRNFRKLAGAK